MPGSNALNHSQRALMAALSRPETYPHDVDDIQCIETHISWVFLTGQYAYKIKKPVNFGFLDFSTLDKRRFFCEEELRLNRRLAESLYVSVVAIIEEVPDSLEITQGKSADNASDAPEPTLPLRISDAGAGKAIEYAVKMRQFDRQHSFDVMLASGTLTLSHMVETAQVLAQFHSKCAVAGQTPTFGTPQAIQQPVMENFRQLALSLHSIFSTLSTQLTIPLAIPLTTSLTTTLTTTLTTENLKKSGVINPDVKNNIDKTLQRLHHWVEDQHASLRSIFNERKNAGFIRECHGDLHLGNITLWQGHVTPFDGIEFNEHFRWIDVMSELAFIIMDLDDHEQPALARQIRSTYLSLTGDYDGLRVLRYYQIYRAMVRAKVAGLSLEQTLQQSLEQKLELGSETPADNAKSTDIEKVNGQLTEINNYLTLAERYTKNHAVGLFITHGVSGSGKSTLSKKISLAADIIHLRSDVERKRYFFSAEKSSPENLFFENTNTHSEMNAGIYTPEATEKIYQHLLQLSRTLLSSGFSVLIDATFLHRQQRDYFKSLADELNLPFTILHCEANDDVLKKRVQQRQAEGKDASEANIALVERQIANDEALGEDEMPYSTIVQPNDAENILKQLFE